VIRKPPDFMARRRYELTDRLWSIIAPLLPNKPRGVTRVDGRWALDGIMLSLRRYMG
jgi:transposase